MTNRFRPGQEERRAADNDRAALARAVVQGRIEDAKRLAEAELQRQNQREIERLRNRR
jgi:hypothetical protein